MTQVAYVLNTYVLNTWNEGVIPKFGIEVLIDVGLR